jgi:hypothetical protein
MDARIISNWIYKEEGVRMCTEFRKKSSGGLM